MKTIIEYVKQTRENVTSILVVHNDLITNDWSKLFQLLAQDNSYQAVANGHSFYEQCLPSNSLSIGYSSTSINWMSKIPCHISNHCIHIFAKENEEEAYKNQAKLDYNAFIEHHSRELVSGGILILSIPSVDQHGIFDVNPYFDVLYLCAQTLLNTKDLMDFSLPLYYRSLFECVDKELFDRCSLELIKVKLDSVKVPLIEQYQTRQSTLDQWAKGIAKIFESFVDTTLKQTLTNNGHSNEEINQLSINFWILYEEKLKERPHIASIDARFASIHLVLKKVIDQKH
ncbi:hypothetical protein I4U23_012252 [Adineta vaga]|nr:hypothetical protein I4U23_012252 [Adineta vaga]